MPHIFCSENIVWCINEVHFRLNFIMKAKNMNSGQIAPCPYCLRYRLLKNISRSELQIRLCIVKIFSLFLIQNICCVYSNEPSQ